MQHVIRAAERAAALDRDEVGHVLDHAHDRAIAAFNHAVVAGEEPNASGLDGLRSVQLTDGIARSAREGRVVELAAEEVQGS